ncbi:MAG: hypothetical protein J6Y15_08965 [Bacteroidaceae bacterium]|nr:hypothetical protein [Bacteroidaceae bacterium]
MKHSQYYSALIFAIIAYALLVMHSEYLYALQDNSIFIGGHTYMQELLNRNQGLWIWVGSYLTQFFYYPWLGALMLTMVWVATHLSLIVAFRPKGYWHIIPLLPVAFQLYAVMTFGYYIYYSKCPGYVFAMAVCILIMSIVAMMIRLAIDRFTKIKAIYTNIALALCCIIYIVANPVVKLYSWTYPSKNFFAELKMYHAMDECRWDDVINENIKAKEPTNFMVMMKNVALIHTNKFDDMLKTNNCGTLYDAPDSLQVRTSRIGAPMLYYQFGQFNFAYRWAIENSVEYGMSIRHMKILIRSAMYNQELDLAQKYINLLKSTKFHRDWAIQKEREIHSSTLFYQSEECGNVVPLIVDDDVELDNDNSNCQEWIIRYFSSIEKAKNEKQQNVALCFSLVAKDGYRFATHFIDYVKTHPQGPIPHLYQEAAIMFGSMPDEALDISGFDFDNIIAERYNNFVREFYDLKEQKLSDEEMASKLKPLYGETYWWYYYFYTDMMLY